MSKTKYEKFLRGMRGWGTDFEADMADFSGASAEDAAYDLAQGELDWGENSDVIKRYYKSLGISPKYFIERLADDLYSVAYR